jgi:hypothetical protein
MSTGITVLKQVSTMLNGFRDKVDQEIEVVFARFLRWIVDYVLWEWLEIQIRSYTLSRKDVDVMGDRGYYFSGDQGRFVRE